MPPHGKAAAATSDHGRTATIHDLVANPYSLEKVGENSAERDRLAVELYEHNLRELTAILNGPRGMWNVRLTSVGAIEETTRCKATMRPGRDCFTIFIPAPGERPRFGHTQMLNKSQANVHSIMLRDATTIATAQERAHSAHKAGLLSAEDAEETLTDLRRRFHQLPPSASAAEEERRKEAERQARLARERQVAEALAAAEAMPSFESLMAAFAHEDEQQQRGQQQQAALRQAGGTAAAQPAASAPGAEAAGGGPSGLSKSARRRKSKKKAAAALAGAVAPSGAADGGGDAEGEGEE